MELRRYIESFSQYENPRPPVSERIEIGRKFLFDFDYPFFDESYRPVFETNFIRQFYFKEMGFDVKERFKFELENYLRLNMGYYNSLFESELLEYDVLSNYKMTEEYKRNVDKKQDSDNKTVSDSDLTNKVDTTGSGKATGRTNTSTNDNATNSGSSTIDGTNKSTGTSSSKNDTKNDEVYSDTPQGKLSNKDYATNATFTDNKNNKSGTTSSNDTNKSTGSNRSSSTSNGSQLSNSDQSSSSISNQDTVQKELSNESRLGKYKTLTVEDYILTKVGKVGERNYPKMIEEYRKTLLRIELQIFSEMNKQLFMLIYNY